MTDFAPPSLPYAAELLKEIDQRQEKLLADLDALNSEIEKLLLSYGRGPVEEAKAA